jgi:hypothetical protein
VGSTPPPAYQQIAEKARHLRELGMSFKAISRSLDVDDKTVARAVAWLRECAERS